MFKANLPEDIEGETEEVEEAELVADKAERTKAEQDDDSHNEDSEDELDDGDKPRIHRLLDEQFDLVTTLFLLS